MHREPHDALNAAPAQEGGRRNHLHTVCPDEELEHFERRAQEEVWRQRLEQSTDRLVERPEHFYRLALAPKVRGAARK